MMSETRALQLASVVFVAIGAVQMFAGWNLKLSGLYGPGPGFFPFVIGTALVISAAAWLVQVTLGLHDASEVELETDRRGLRNVALVMAALVAFGVAMPLIGFNLSMLLLLLALMFGFDRSHVIAKLILSVGLSFGVHYVFETALRVPLPYASIQALRALGL
jgi:hypothetical protein